MRGHSQFVGAAGQHYIAYCLSIRKIHAAVTLGNVPDVDIIICETRWVSGAVPSSQNFPLGLQTKKVWEGSVRMGCWCIGGESL